MNNQASLPKPIKLDNRMLVNPPSGILVPSYNRTNLSPGIVHIGVGNFHRAHQSWYLHRLMQKGLAHDWAIIGAGVRPFDAIMRDNLITQDCLTTLFELAPSLISAEVVGSMIDYLPVQSDNAALIQQLSDPSTRIVSMTVTEGGYFLDPGSGEFDSGHEDICHDVDNPLTPRTVFGAIIAALGHRKESGLGPLTVLSCDNLSRNGDILRNVIVSLAELNSSQLARWINTNCSFPNSMVDCIVPVTTDNEFELASSLGIIDAAPVSHENFRQWVIEDNFCAGRPPLEQVGVIFSNDVHKYETMKLRILNAGHQVLANIGEVLSIETISGCMADPLIRAFFRKVEIDEIAPGVEPLPSINPLQYIDLIETRFSNPAINDTTRRVAFDGSSRHAGFVLPILNDGLKAGASITGLALVEALWARMCSGLREDGSSIEPNDPIWEQLQETAVKAQQKPYEWLLQRELYGDLANDQSFTEAFSHWLSIIWSKGCREAVRIYLGKS